ncbi:MAG: hypothetical protein R3338_10680 [Thermoanaerobaculia bacterium]|nr:hypothetical protein [Thermoanaerobaculia bacterium]
MKRLILSAAILLPALSPLASANEPAVPRQNYALHLEANPSEPFPFLKKLGKVEISVFPEGVRADSLWLDGFVLQGADTVRIENPALRLYTDASFDSLRKLFQKLRPENEEQPALKALKVVDTGRVGKIGKLPVRCHRIVLGEKAWIDLWWTSALAKNPAYERLQHELLSVVSPDLALAARRVPGTIVHVVLNTERFPDTTLLAVREVYLSSAGHEEALKTGRFFLRAPSLDRLVK